MENRPYDSGYDQIGRNERHLRAPPDPRRQRKILLIAIGGVLLAVALFAGSFRPANRFSDKGLSSIRERILHLGERQ